MKVLWWVLCRAQSPLVAYHTLPAIDDTLATAKGAQSYCHGHEKAQEDQEIDLRIMIWSV